MGYQNFRAAFYCPVGNLKDITDWEEFEKKYEHLEKNVEIGKVYLETYRAGVTIEREQMQRIKAFFEKKGVLVAGGITTEDIPRKEGGFSPFCYSQERTVKKLSEIAEMTAELFDEFILDDFYFTNCRCTDCIKKKGDQSWEQFRLDLMYQISKDVIISSAKRVNPKVKVIIKYPNWYEHYQETGYNLKEQPAIFDAIYTGTETRNPKYTQQHLPKYLSYFLMRYLEHVAPGRNLGGWFDPYECNYNLTSYLEQGSLTLLAKAKETMLFCLGSLMEDPSYSVFAPAVGQLFLDTDRYLNLLGTPYGCACYLPYHSHGEDYLHNYIGMCGIPLEPYPEYPSEASRIFLTQSAACDPKIIDKIKQSLLDGACITVTSGFVKAAGETFFDLAHIIPTDRKAAVCHYAYSENGGVSFGGTAVGALPVQIPQLEFFTNDTWELAAGFGEDNSFPILVRTRYGNGQLNVLTIPDDFGQVYQYPKEVLWTIRKEICGDMELLLNAPAKIALFLYDNHTFVLHSFAQTEERIELVIPTEKAVIKDLIHHRDDSGSYEEGITRISLSIAPGTNFIGILEK